MTQHKTNDGEELSEALTALHDHLRPALEDDALICECYCVSVQDIRLACADTRVVDLEVLQARFGLGQGCGQCARDAGNWGPKIFES